jgi:predicted O-linked N-acetylglucosamine transferase (SPINDLY family)
MNLNYVFDDLEDKMYITNQHKLVNKLYTKGNGMYKFDKSFYSGNSGKINIGIISGDFVDHPVSFFISSFLRNFNTDLFNVTCYSECVIDTSLFNKDLKFKFIKNMSSKNAADLIYKDKCHILFDLAGHTAFNRMDVFALKPSPIQITYIGYPFSTGLNEMDYRITDDICDTPDISQKFYTEQLLYLKNCFLCYDPTVIKRTASGKPFDFKIPDLPEQQPFVKNGYLTICCYNRVNKITDHVIKIFNNILVKNPSVKFLFKTKALLNKQIANEFINKFDTKVRDRVEILDCTILHETHLLKYNPADIAIDTFPYSGTTTSCEALFMGVPVFSLYDSENSFHPQNVTASLLKNSDLDYYVVNTETELQEKIIELQSKDLSGLKQEIRSKFMNGKVCDKKEHLKNITELLQGLYEKHSNAM